MVSAPKLCPACKVRHSPSDIKKCPLIAKLTLPKIQKMGKEFFGPSSSIFVGYTGYPKVNIGPMGILETENYITPEKWFGKDYPELLSMRSSLIRSKYKQDIYSREKFISESQEIVLAKSSTDIELVFRKKPNYDFEFSSITSPLGPSASIQKFRLAENPKISKKLEYIVSDELKAAESSEKLYDIGIDLYKIENILSSGALGLGKDKKLVPTRWSITAADDILGKHIIEKVKKHQSINKHMVFESEYLDNHFIVLLAPGNWEFENFEAWAPGSYWAFSLKQPEILEEYESWKGRTSYAEKQVGGYYASRIGVAEALNKMKKQARVVVFREIYEGYTIPVGVWQVRENVRNAFRQKPSEFSSIESALKHISSKLRINIRDYVRKSKILQQRRMGQY